MTRERRELTRDELVPVSVTTAEPAALPPLRSVELRHLDLDGMRALAVLCMVVYHAFFLLPVMWPVAYPWMLRFDLSVEVFFMLSGFLIYGPYGRAHLRGTPPPRLGSYLLRRAARIYPAYWAAIGAMALLGWVHFGDGAEALQHLTLTQGYFPRDGSHFLDPPGLGQAWTLAVEASFYAFVPVWAWAMRRLAVAAGVDPFRQEVAGTAMLFAAGVGAATIAAASPFPVAVAILPTHLTSLSWGMLLALVAAHRHPPAPAPPPEPGTGPGPGPGPGPEAMLAGPGLTGLADAGIPGPADGPVEPAGRLAGPGLTGRADTGIPGLADGPMEPGGTLVAGPGTGTHGGMVEIASGGGVEPDGSPATGRAWARAGQVVRASATEVSWLGAWVVLALGSLRLDTVSNEAGHVRLLHVVNLIAGMLLVTPVMLGAPGRGWVRWLLTCRPVVFVGLASYGVYLWHLDLFMHLPGPWVAEPSGPALAGMAARVVVVIAAGTVSFFLLERPLMRWAAARRPELRRGVPGPVSRRRRRSGS